MDEPKDKYILTLKISPILNFRVLQSQFYQTRNLEYDGWSVSQFYGFGKKLGFSNYDIKSKVKYFKTSEENLIVFSNLGEKKLLKQVEKSRQNLPIFKLNLCFQLSRRRAVKNMTAQKTTNKASKSFGTIYRHLELILA